MSLATNSDFLITISLQLDGVNLLYFKLRLFDITEFIVWNIFSRFRSFLYTITLRERSKGVYHVKWWDKERAWAYNSCGSLPQFLDLEKRKVFLCIKINLCSSNFFCSPNINKLLFKWYAMVEKLWYRILQCSHFTFLLHSNLRSLVQKEFANNVCKTLLF